MKVIFLCNWGSSETGLLETYKKFTKNNSGIFENIQGVNNIEESDCIVFLEGIPNKFDLSLLNSKKVICFPREPKITKNWEKLDIQYGFTYNNFYHVVTYPQFIDKSYDFLSKMKYNNRKLNVSAIVSSKCYDDDYKKRIRFFITLSLFDNSLCDIYGFGWKNQLGKSYKGPLDSYHNKKYGTNQSKYDALINYKYSICIENCSQKNYFTEKITDAILCWCIPIYYGCTNISEYFPEGSYYWIDINDENVYENVKKIVNLPITEKNILALSEARELILNKYNIWSTIKNINN